ncbi:hypothetical protein [Janthinobacterium sp. UMAB-60]|uniref:hypothetical protein n=1 Tax=Janthinobacterium sp. UMAB-60 TaxID=1365365 RepID=UPI001C55C83A|nr:hypothetical protein [Janthinobacterium sp. UMAB-60]
MTLRLSILLSLLCSALALPAAQAEDAPYAMRAASASVPGALDLAFMEEAPNRKFKRRVDLSGITRADELAVVKAAINPIVQFFQMTGQVRQPAHAIRMVTTHNGELALIKPPRIDDYNYLLARRLWNWTVHDAQTISLTVEFVGLSNTQPHYSNTYVFVERYGTWLFDRHML